MKRIICLLMLIMLLFGICGCSKNAENPGNTVVTILQNITPNESSVIIENDKTDSSSDIDVDLTKLSSTMVYSEVYNMVSSPEEYLGKKVRMMGEFSVYLDEETNKKYFACIISDATACCAQGLEFVLEGEHSYPEDYPEIGAPIIIDGIFDTYIENGNQFCQLINAKYA